MSFDLPRKLLALFLMTFGVFVALVSWTFTEKANAGGSTLADETLGRVADGGGGGTLFELAVGLAVSLFVAAAPFALIWFSRARKRLVDARCVALVAGVAFLFVVGLSFVHASLAWGGLLVALWASVLGIFVFPGPKASVGSEGSSVR